MTAATATAARADMALWFRVQSFYNVEARLIDDLQLTDWVELFTDDVRYWMPLVTNRIGRDLGKERSRFGEVAHFDENKTSLVNRVKRLATGMAWAETPPSRTRHFITNVEIMDASDDGSLQVRSNFLVYRSHLEHDQELFSGFRDDTLRPHGDSWKVARRGIVLDASVVLQKSLGIFF